MTICFRCKRVPEQIEEYRDMALLEGTTANQEARADGTYNVETDHFCCTECYTALGMPTAPDGWKAP